MSLSGHFSGGASGTPEDDASRAQAIVGPQNWVSPHLSAGELDHVAAHHPDPAVQKKALAQRLTGPYNDVSKLGPKDLAIVRAHHPEDSTRRSAIAHFNRQEYLSRPLPRPGPRVTTTPR